MAKRVGGGNSRDEHTVKGDPVARERGDERHQFLERAISDLCIAHGLKPLKNKHIDLYVQAGSISVAFEMKVSALGMVRPVRRAIYELLEYRFVYRHELASEVRLCVVAERQPAGIDGRWLLSYMEDLGIGVIWRNEGGEGLGCSKFTKTHLGGVLPELVGWSTEQFAPPRPPEPLGRRNRRTRKGEGSAPSG